MHKSPSGSGALPHPWTGQPSRGVSFRAVRQVAHGLLQRCVGNAPPAAQGLIAAVFAGWLIAVGYSARHLATDDLLALLPVVVLTALVQRFHLGLYTSKSYISLSSIGCITAGLLAGVPGVVLTSTVAVLVLSAQRTRTKLHALLFNLGSVTLANVAGVAGFAAWHRATGAGQPLLEVPGAVTAGAVVYLCESGVVTLIIAITQRRPVRRVWAENYRWLLPHWMGLGLVALGLALAYRSSGVAGLLAFAGPALLMRYSVKQYLERTSRSVEELSARNRDLERANQEIAAMTARLQETYTGTLEALVAALDARDRETHGHSMRVARLTTVLAAQLGVQQGTQEWLDIERGALLHDVGKIGVVDGILHKAGRLTDEEWAEMRRHPRIGYEMLKDIPFLSGAAAIVASHHERWDGQGYPGGLAGDAIPLGARIFMVADTFDAMATDRPYRRARPYAQCLAEISRCAGTQFDPAVVDALHAIFPQWMELHRKSIAPAGGPRLAAVG